MKILYANPYYKMFYDDIDDLKHRENFIFSSIVVSHVSDMYRLNEDLICHLYIDGRFFLKLDIELFSVWKIK
jgi:hypothetical protein